MKSTGFSIAAAISLLMLGGCSSAGPSVEGSPATQAASDWCITALPESAVVGAGFKAAKFGVSAAAKAESAATAPAGVQCFWTSDNGNISVGRLDFTDAASATKYMDGLAAKVGSVSPSEEGQKVDGFDQLRAHLTPSGVYLLYLRQGATVYRGGLNGCADESSCGDSIAGLVVVASKASKPTLPGACASAKGDEFKLVVLSSTDETTTYFGVVGADGQPAYVVHDAKAAENLGFVAVAEPVTSSETSAAGPTSINGTPVDITGDHLDSAGFWLEKPWAISVDSDKAVLTQVGNNGDASVPFVPGSMFASQGAACTLFD